MVLAVASPHVDILGHCTGRKLGFAGRPVVRNRSPTFDAELVFAACARFDTAVEINCRPERQDPPDDAARAGARVGLPVQHRHRRARPRPARVAELRLRQGGRATTSAPSAS